MVGLIIDGINIRQVTVKAYRMASKSALFSLNISISQPVKVGPPPRAIILRIKKNSAVDMARILIGANVCAIAKLGPTNSGRS